MWSSRRHGSGRIDGRSVACEERDRDRYGRVVAVCRYGGQDVNAWLVREGWAIAYRRYSMAYVGAEADAKAAKRGVWRGKFGPPWDWRRGDRLESASRGDRVKATQATEGMTMEVYELVRACQVELRHGDKVGAAQEMALKRRVELLATPGVASGLLTCAVNGEDADSEHSLDLLEALFEHTRIGEENRRRHGDHFLDKAGTLIEAQVFLDGVDPPAIHGLRMVYARADIDVPPALALCPIGHIGALRETDRLPYDPDTEIDRFRTLLAAAAYTLYQVLDERIGAYPAVTRAAFAYDVGCRAEEVCGRTALYWVLDLSAQVRLADADGFRERTKSKYVQPLPAALLPLIRNWMLADATRTALDAALQDARRRGLFARPPHSTRRPLGVPPKLIIFNGFLVGAGAQHCQGQIRQRDRFATTMTIPTRNGDFGVTRAGSEWPARRAHSTACPNA